MFNISTLLNNYFITVNNLNIYLRLEIYLQKIIKLTAKDVKMILHPMNNSRDYLLGGFIMKHLKVGVAFVSVLVICLYYNIVVVDFNLLLGNISSIANWTAQIFLAAVFVSCLKK